MRKLTIVVLLLLLLVVLFYGMHYYRNMFHEKIAKLPQKYCYETFSGVVNPAFYVEDKKLTSDLIEYYEKIERDSSATPVFNFPIRTLPQKQPVYIMGYYDPDSLIVEVYCYYTNGVWYNGNLRGFVYAKTLHNNFPPD